MQRLEHPSAIPPFDGEDIAALAALVTKHATVLPALDPHVSAAMIITANLLLKHGHDCCVVEEVAKQLFDRIVGADGA